MRERPLWRDRRQAGRELAGRLSAWRDHPSAWVIGLPRGGIPPAAEIARSLGLPLACWPARKLAHPMMPEVALGAMAPGGVVLWDTTVPRGYRLNPTLRRVLETEAREELERRQRRYGVPPAAALAGRPLIVVDDGVATGLTARAALQSLGEVGAGPLVLATPVIESDVAATLRPGLHELVSLAEVPRLGSVGAWYEQFDQLEDEEVLGCLEAGPSRPPHS